MRFFFLIFLIALSAEASLERAERRANISGEIIERRMTSAQPIPRSIWEQAKCVASLRGVKEGFEYMGGSYAAGLVSCRVGNNWSLPSYIILATKSAGLEMGVEISDTVLLFMTDEAKRRLMGPSLMLGASLGLTAGPIGGDAGRAIGQVLSYSFSVGAFGGITLEGSYLHHRRHRNIEVYRVDAPPSEILTTLATTIAPSSVRPFVDELYRLR